MKGSGIRDQGSGSCEETAEEDERGDDQRLEHEHSDVGSRHDQRAPTHPARNVRCAAVSACPVASTGTTSTCGLSASVTAVVFSTPVRSAYTTVTRSPGLWRWTIVATSSYERTRSPPICLS